MTEFKPGCVHENTPNAANKKCEKFLKENPKAKFDDDTDEYALVSKDGQLKAECFRTDPGRYVRSISTWSLNKSLNPRGS